jgi:hypothetical protein
MLIATPVNTETAAKKVDGAELFPHGEPMRVAAG